MKQTHDQDRHLEGQDPVGTRIVVLASHGANFFAYCIALASAIREARVRIGDDLVPQTTELVWLTHSDGSARGALRRLLRRYVGRVELADRMAMAVSERRSRTDSDDDEASLLARVESGETVYLPELDVVVQGKILETSWSITAFNSLRAGTKILALAFRFKDKFQNQVLRLRVKGIHVGDVVASTALTKFPLLSREPRALRALARTLARAETIVRRVHREPLGKVHYVLSAEPSYLPMLGPRIMETHGVQPLLGDRRDALIAVSGSLQHAYPHSSQIREQMRIRRDAGVPPCEGMCEHLQRVRLRMDLLSGQDSPGMCPQLIRIAKSRKAIAVLFLHDFGDGQFLYGYDEFGDLFSWVTYVIDTLIQESDCTVLVKTHSIIKPSYRTLNNAAVARLKQRYKLQQRVSFLEYPVSPMHIAETLKDCHWFGVTRHGTIAEELPLIGRACIASTLSPWGDRFRFVWPYSSKSELNNLLARVHDVGLVEDWRPELCTYVQHRYENTDNQDLKGTGPHRLSRFIDQRRGFTSAELHGNDEWKRSAFYVRRAKADDELLIQAIRHVASERRVELDTAREHA
jgi:hypothetical protein